MDVDKYFPPQDLILKQHLRRSQKRVQARCLGFQQCLLQCLKKMIRIQRVISMIDLRKEWWLVRYVQNSLWNEFMKLLESINSVFVMEWLRLLQFHSKLKLIVDLRNESQQWVRFTLMWNVKLLILILETLSLKVLKVKSGQEVIQQCLGTGEMNKRPKNQ